MTLHFYFARRFLIAFSGVLAGLFIMLALIDMVDQIRRFGDADIAFATIVSLTLLNVPEAIYRILPLISILAAIALFLALARSSELVVSRAAGRSAVISVAAPLAVAFLIGAGAVTVLNPIVAATSKQYERLSNRYLGQASSTFSVGPEGVWLRQGGARGQTVIRADRANLDGTVLYGTSFQSFDNDGIPVRRVDAAEARLTPGAWELRQAKSWPLASGVNPEAASETFETATIPTNLTREEISDSFGVPSAIPIWELPGFIARLEAAGFSARQHKVWLQMEMALPVLLAAMVLVAAAFTLRPQRGGRTGMMVVMALTLGFALYFVRNFAQILGESGQVPILLAAWGPPVAALLLPAGLLLHEEDG